MTYKTKEFLLATQRLSRAHFVNHNYLGWYESIVHVYVFICPQNLYLKVYYKYDSESWIWDFLETWNIFLKNFSNIYIFNNLCVYVYIKNIKILGAKIIVSLDLMQI